MKRKKVKDFMVQLSEYAIVREDASLLEAVAALEESQKKYDKSRYPHRAIFVLDNDGGVSGKISQLDVMRAIEPVYDELQDNSGLAHLGFRKAFIQSIFTTYNLWSRPFEDICSRGAERKVRDFMHKLVETEYANADDSLDLAVHQLVFGNHQSLLVMDGEKAVGVLRLTDVFTYLADMIKQCKK